MFKYIYKLDGHEVEQTPGVGDGQGSLVCCRPWGHRVRQDWMTELNWIYMYGLPCWLSGKELACNPGAAGDSGSIPGLRRSRGGGNDNPLQYSCLENPSDRGTWLATVHGHAESGTTEVTYHTTYIHIYIYTHTQIEQNIEQKSHTAFFSVLDFISSWTFIKRSHNRNLKTNRCLVCWRTTHLALPPGPPAWWAPPPPFSSSPFDLTLSSSPSVSLNSQKTSNYSSYTLMSSSATSNSNFYQ